MVRILPNGEIVSENDSRAQSSSSTPGSDTRPRQGMGRIQHDPNAGNPQYQGGGQQVSPFDMLNQRLAGYGVPRFNIGQHTIEPIVLIGFALAGLFLGLPGLLFAAILFYVSKMSTAGGGLASFFGGGVGQGQGQDRQGPSSGNSRPSSGGGGGHRLGRS